MKILMVCHGNICRSPLADGLLRKKAKALHLPLMVDSAGTSDYHKGEAPDNRMTEVAKRFGTDLSYLRARPIVPADLDEFDVIYTMDRENYWNVMSMCKTKDQENKIIPILDLIYPEQNRSVPDPYYGGEQGFIEVYKMLDKATDKIIELYKKNYVNR